MHREKLRRMWPTVAVVLACGVVLLWAIWQTYRSGELAELENQPTPITGFSSPVADVYEGAPESGDDASLSASGSTAPPPAPEVPTPPVAVESVPEPVDELSGVGVVDVPDPAPGETTAPEPAPEVVTDDGDDFTDEWGGDAPEPVMTGVSAEEDASYDACQCAGMDMTGAQYTNADGEGIWEGPGGLCWVDPAGNLFTELP